MRTFRRLLPAGVLMLALACPALAQNSVRGPSQPPLPMKILEQDAQDAAAKKPGRSSAEPKFPNKDTAKNRQDYELGTEHGADGVHIGRDEATGENVMRATPPKRAPQKDPFEAQPIIVQPRIRP